MNQHRKAKQELVRQAEANAGTIRVSDHSGQWRYLETMVDNGEFERIANDGDYAIYRLLRGSGRTEVRGSTGFLK